MMINNKPIVLLLLFTVIFFMTESYGQKGRFSAAVEESWLMPIGTLGDRWEATSGTAIYFGVTTSEKWTWGGKAEIFRFFKLNSDKLFVPNTQVIGNTSYTFNIPLTGLSHTLDVFGISLNAKYNVVRSKFVEANVDLGFGVYNWTYKRDAHDSLSYDATVNGTPYHFLVFGNAVANSQTDWSGGFSIGAEICVKVMNPIELTVAGNYKNIVGELWPAIIYNLDNVSTFQMIDARAGIRIIF